MICSLTEREYGGALLQMSVRTISLLLLVVVQISGIDAMMGSDKLLLLKLNSNPA